MMHLQLMGMNLMVLFEEEAMCNLRYKTTESIIMYKITVLQFCKAKQTRSPTLSF